MKDNTINNKLFFMKKLKYLCILVLVSFALFLLYNGSVLAYSEDAVFSDVEIEQNYAMGYELTVPQSTLSIEGKDLPSQAVVIFPSGTALMKDKIRLSEAGIYTINYTAFYSGNYYKSSKSFNVYRDLYSFSGEESSAEYGIYEYANKSGLKVRLAEGETLTFGTVFDVNDSTLNDTLIDFFAAPEDKDKAEFKKLIITLTDVTDENVFVKILCQGTLEEWCYTLVGGNGQSMVGLEQHASGPRLHINNQFGTSINYRLYGEYKDGGALGSRIIRYSYDKQSNAFYLHNSKIADLDDAYYYYNLWHGFKSGFVRMSITCDDYYASHANFMVLRLMDTDLQADVIKDETGPSLNVNMHGYQTAPKAKTGHPYPIFTASAFDKYDGECEVKVNVFKKYDTNRINVAFANNEFIPSTNGEYVIEYSANDYSGNATKKTVRVIASDTVIKPIINIEGGRITSASAGNFIRVADFGVGGGTGNIVSTIQAVSLSERLNVVDNQFMPMYGETYTVIYTATDFIGQTSVRSYNVEVSPNDKPVFNTAPDLLPYYINNNDYTIPQFYATDYANGGIKVLSTVTIKDASGIRTITSGNTFKPVVNNNLDEVSFTFNAGAASVTYSVPVIVDRPGGVLRMDNFFVTNGVTANATDDSILITAQSGGGGWTFAKRQLADIFSIELLAKENSASYKGLALTLTDSQNKNIAIEIRFLKEGDRTKIICGDKEYQNDYNFNNSETALNVSYSQKEFKIGAFPIKVFNSKNGQPFNGFSSNFVYVTLEFIDADINASYHVKKLCLHALSNRTSDNQRANILILNNDYGGSFRIGSKAIIPAALASDVLSEKVKFTLG